MKTSEKIRCVNLKTGMVKHLVPAIANNLIRMRSLGFKKDEIPVFPSLEKTPIAPIAPIVEDKLVEMEMEIEDKKENEILEKRKYTKRK